VLFRSIEVRDLLHRLYGETDTRGTSNPYVAKYTRLRANALPESRDSQEYGHVVGTVDYRYWPSLKLGYIENVRVSPNIRRKGLGIKLVDFALDYMRSSGIRRIYSFAVNPEGSGLLESAGFAPEPPENAERPWRRWFSTA
jgi:N-acetylglutamate synthase-like GNAT family acetyltransferase